MKIFNVPYYCGGRFLCGLYEHQRAKEHDDLIVSRCLEEFNINPMGFSNQADPYPYVPYDLLKFQQLLKHILNIRIKDSDGCGIAVVYAVTNGAQKVAERHLAASGFKIAAKASKYTYYEPCTTWIGDFHNDIFPILTKIPSIVIKSNAAKFA